MTIRFKKQPKNKDGEELKSIQMIKEDGTKWSVPFDPANTDYQEYLEWVAAGNTADAAD